MTPEEKLAVQRDLVVCCYYICQLSKGLLWRLIMHDGGQEKEGKLQRRERNRMNDTHESIILSHNMGHARSWL